jgi:hypothetical protein
LWYYCATAQLVCLTVIVRLRVVEKPQQQAAVYLYLCYPHYAVYMPAMPCAVHAQECRLLAREQQQQRFQVLTDRQQAAGSRPSSLHSSAVTADSRQLQLYLSSSSSSSRRAPIRGISIRGLQPAGSLPVCLPRLDPTLAPPRHFPLEAGSAAAPTERR